MIRAAVHGDRSLEGAGQRLGRVRRKKEAVARHRFRIELGDRVAQAAGRAHDRNRAVLERIHLCESARFELRRHQEYVRRGLNPMRHRVIEA